MKGTKFEGILPALITPFEKDGKTVNEQAARRLIELQLSQGANGFYILGGTGEGLVMGIEQRERMCEIAIDEVKGRKPVICHIASMNLDEAIALAKHAERVGADAVASVPPLFFAYSEGDIYDYYKAIAESIHIPLIIYYHPAAQKDMRAALIAHIFEIDNVTGVKWSSSNLFEMMKLKILTQGDMNIINGPDELLVEGLSAGADAGIGSTYNLMLPQFVEIYELVRAGRIDEARAVQMKINPVIEVLLNYELIPAVKAGVTLMGYEGGDATYPMRRYTDAELKELAGALAAAGWQFLKN